ncbi:MAG: ABC transporter substrate-binding protein [Thermomicrobiales bacterium]
MSNIEARIEEIRNGILSKGLNRRDVLRKSLALGLSAPVIAGLLAACGGDDDDDDDDDEPTAADSGGNDDEPTATEASGGDDEPTATEASGGDDEPTATEASGGDDEPTATEEAMTDEKGGSGRVNLLNWQAATILNPHLAQGGKDFLAASVYLLPLADFDNDGNLVPVLATEIPSLENGLLAEDGTSVTWKLRENVLWHDGTPFTSKDVVFTWEYVTHPDAAAITTKSNFDAVQSVEAVDDYTVTITFDQPTPAWFDPYTTTQSLVIPEHILKDYMGDTVNDAPFNLEPIGTGPYKVVDFRPGDTVLFEINMDYFEAGKPHFDEVELKGGGDATSAARAVLQTGDVDYAVNLQVEAEILIQLSEGGVGELLTPEGPGLERIMINFTDPNVEVDGERSHISNPHPALSNREFREALSYLCDRDTIATQLYGPTGNPASNILTQPPRFASTNTTYEFNIDRAREILADAGWAEEDGVLSKDGYSCNFIYQTSTNSVRQKNQEIVKQALEEVGIRTEIKAIDAGVYFSSDPGNPDTYAHFYADLEMFTNSGTVYPIRYMSFWKSTEPETDIPQKSNEWGGRNIERWHHNPEAGFDNPKAEDYNALWLEANEAIDPERQNELFIGMNDILVNEFVEIPLVARNSVNGKANSITGHEISVWASSFWDIQNWDRE